MSLILGVDEAGYGPVLGPLVCGATLWRVPPADGEIDLWRTLAAAVVRPGGGADSRLTIGDSKKVFNRDRGLHTLERPVLAVAAAAGAPITTLGEWLATVGDGPFASRCPWYRDLSAALPTDLTRSAFAGGAARLAGAMRACGATCEGLRARVVAEDVYNARLAQTRNKASVLLEHVLALIAWGLERAGDAPLHVRVDRLGGREHYRTILMDAFAGWSMHVLDETETRSAYRLTSGGRAWTVEFAAESEQRHLPVALASMLAKYIRELLMGEFNRYWRALLPTLRPSAGYYTDAQRFLAEIGPVVGQAGVPREWLVRAR